MSGLNYIGFINIIDFYYIRLNIVFKFQIIYLLYLINFLHLSIVLYSSDIVLNLFLSGHLLLKLMICYRAFESYISDYSSKIRNIFPLFPYCFCVVQLKCRF